MAAARLRQLARAMREEAGLSGRGIASVLHVSAQRVSQLLRSGSRTRIR
jgi:predicted transcriptional regulator